MRIALALALALGVVAVAWSAAVYVHQRHTWSAVFTGPHVRQRFGYNAPLLRVRQHPSWEDPVAVLIAIGGVAVGVGIIAYRNRHFANPS